MDDDRVLAALLAMEDRLGTKLAGLDSRLDRLETRLTAVETRLTAVETRLTAVETRLTALETKVSDLEQRASATDTTVNELRSVMMAKFERIENKLTQISEDMQVTMGAASTAIQQREGDRRDLGVFVEMVTLMQRKMSRLQTDVEELQKKAS